jgi:hypothetical protein
MQQDTDWKHGACFCYRRQITPTVRADLCRTGELARQMKEAGYVHGINFVLHDVEEEKKENILLHQSEKLAIAFGIINRPPRMPIRIFENLRVCGNFHTASKIISKIDAREIVIT